MDLELFYPLSLALDFMQQSSNDLQDEVSVHMKHFLSVLTSLN